MSSLLRLVLRFYLSTKWLIDKSDTEVNSEIDRHDDTIGERIYPDHLIRFHMLLVCHRNIWATTSWDPDPEGSD